MSKISLSEVQDAQQKALETFSHYRINAIKYRLIPRTNMAGGYVSAGDQDVTSIQCVATVFNPNRDRTYPNFNSIVANPRHKTHNPFREINRFCKMRPQATVLMAGGNQVDLTLPRNTWVSTADIAAEYGTFIIGLDDSAGSDTLYNIASCWYIEATYYVSLKNFVTNVY